MLRWVSAMGVSFVMVTLALAFAASRSGPASAAPTSFAAGSLIMPMSTDTAGNHAAFNQNQGMWKAYGLVYKLLQNGIPIRWGISETKTGINDVDFTVTNVRDKRTGTNLASYD